MIPSPQSRIAVIGAGITGLIAAYHLSQRHKGEIVLIEREASLGGLAASFQMNGVWTENFYHFICKPDKAYFALIEELGLSAYLRWRLTRMSYYAGGVLRRFGDPISLLRFSPISFPARLRAGLAVYRSKLRHDWKDLEDVPAIQWLREAYGEEAYRILWQRALELKFHEHTSKISAAWIWTRTKRVALSRRSLFREELGYLSGGTRTLVEALTERLIKAGVTIRTECAVTGLESKDGLINGVKTSQGTETFDAVISTVPQYLLADLLPVSCDEAYRKKLKGITYLGLNCLVLQVKHPLTDSFWLNISDPDIPLSGLIEYTNLNAEYHPQGLGLWYTPEYLTWDHPRFKLDAQTLLDSYLPIFRQVNPAFSPDWIVGVEQKRIQAAQAVCPTGFTRVLPGLGSPYPNLVSGDTCQFWPEDRTVTDAIDLGRHLVDHLDNHHE